MRHQAALAVEDQGLRNGVIFAAQVNGKVASGDIAGAVDASKKAKLFSFIAIGIGLAVGLIYLLLTILGIGLGALGNR